MVLTRRGIVVGGLAATGLATAGASLMGRTETDTDGEWFPTNAEIFRDSAAPMLGNPDGDVTVVEFFDYQCPFCRENHEPLLDVVAADGNVRLLLRDWPIFGAASVRASQLALGAAAMGLYADANRALMNTVGRLDEARIVATLEGAGVDPARAEQAYKDTRRDWDALLGRNARLAAAFNLPGTPAYFIGEDVYPGAVRDFTIRKAIERARAARA